MHKKKYHGGRGVGTYTYDRCVVKICGQLDEYVNRRAKRPVRVHRSAAVNRLSHLFRCHVGNMAQMPFALPSLDSLCARGSRTPSSHGRGIAPQLQARRRIDGRDVDGPDDDA